LRYVVYGAGAIGGSIGGFLHAAGFEAVLICRGAQLDAIRAGGLRMLTPRGPIQADVPVVGHPAELKFRDGDVVVLTMKSQDTEQALLDLETAGGGNLPIICCQNGVENERIAARRYKDVYAMLVAMGADYLRPGQVTNFGSPVPGVLDCGRYPSGVDPLIERIAGDLTAAGMSSRALANVMRFKYAKLLTNLNNALAALTATPRSDEGYRRLSAAMRAEAQACVEAGGIDCATADQYQEEVWSRYKHVDVPGASRGGTSTWQSLTRGTSTVEVDHLNGEIVLLGALYGVPTPCNTAMRRLVQQMVSRREPVGHYTIEELLDAANLSPATA
jgi:2-dehydropantoate 2-reductase